MSSGLISRKMRVAATSAMAARTLASSSTWSPATYAKFKAERLRPPQDLLARLGSTVKLTASQPAILDCGCGNGGSSRQLIDAYPHARLTCIDSSEAMIEAAQADEVLASRELVSFTLRSIEEQFAEKGKHTGELFDLIFSNASLHWCDEEGDALPSLLQRMLGRVRPGGALAMQIPDTREQPSHVIMRDVAAELGRPDVAPPSNRHTAEEYGEALLGPLCAGLDMWSTTYVQRLTGSEPVYDYVRSTGLMPVLEAFGGEGSEGAAEFERLYRARLQEAYPAQKDGTTLFPFARFFLIAKRPSLLDVYSEYAAYHDHQLTKGWKS